MVWDKKKRTWIQAKKVKSIIRGWNEIDGEEDR